METTNHPAEMVSWYDAAEFCAKLSEKDKLAKLDKLAKAEADAAKKGKTGKG